MGFAVGNKLSKYVRVIHLNGLEHVDITDADVRTGKISIDSKGNKVIGAATERFIEMNTSDATALSKDIDLGKTLYVQGKKITGTYVEPTIDNIFRGNTVQYNANENIDSGDFVKIVKSIVGGNNIGTSSPLVFETNDIDNVATLSLSDNKVLVAYRDAGNSWRGTLQIFTIDGATIIEGDKYIFNRYDTQYISMLKLENNKILIAYTDGQNSYGTVQVITINDDVFTTGPKFIFDNVTVIHMSMTKLYSNRVLIAYNDGSNTYGSAQLLTIVDNTVVGSEITVFNQANTINLHTLTLSNNKVLVSYTDANPSGNYYGVSQILTINENTITSSSKFILNDGNTEYIKSIRLGKDKVLTVYIDISTVNKCMAMLLTINEYNIQIGTPVEITSINTSDLSLLLVGDNKALVTYRSTSNGCAIILNIDNDTITPGTEFLFSSGNVTNVSASIMSDNKILIVYNDSTNYDAANIQLLQFDGSDVISNNIYDYIYENKISKIDYVDDTILGIAISSGDVDNSIDVKIPF